MSEIRQRCVERSDKEDVGLNKIEEIKNEVFAEKREGEEERGDGEGEAVRSEPERENEEAEGEGSEKPTAKEKHSDDEAESEDKLLVTAEDIADPVAPPAGKESKENEVLETALSGLPTR
ncbi:PREDICTED: aspartic and glutamic acid-rich protein-like [Priapulus caudatus]|uniref:Aspartic and glutamic acid-rich protein-like n=1 Tax=Priapulus caudatus TaxID=37621 RepID=A0ABM1EVB6_PRICU|nr:PREDICTED: aspartic and glutamic acid-rich protein-like [Priapulus caudatus]